MAQLLLIVYSCDYMCLNRLVSNPVKSHTLSSTRKENDQLEYSVSMMRRWSDICKHSKKQELKHLGKQYDVKLIQTSKIECTNALHTIFGLSFCCNQCTID